MYDIPERWLEPPEARFVCVCKYCYRDVFEGEESLHLDCEEIYLEEMEEGA